jgi:hypothetical protein
MYCGNRDILPDGYADFGNRYNCLKKGFGVGRGILKDKIVNVISDRNLNPDTIRNRIQIVLDDNGGGGGRGGARGRLQSIFSQRILITIFVVILLVFLGLQIYTLVKLKKIEEEKKTISPS